ncbi:MAG: aminoacyl-tRNA hydrolase [Eubacteriales bacterium]
MFFKKEQGTQWLVVALGNIGDRYHNTRHNIGFMVADVLSETHHTPIKKIKFKALTGSIMMDGVSVLVIKPTTFMNLSGEAVLQAAQYHKIPPERILVLSDDVTLPVGKIRIRLKGSHGGHNGLRDIIAKLGTDQFPRIRIGVGEKPHPDYDMADWVLGKFSPQDNIGEVAKIAAQAVEVAVTKGMEPAMQQFNRGGASNGS